MVKGVRVFAKLQCVEQREAMLMDVDWCLWRREQDEASVSHGGLYTRAASQPPALQTSGTIVVDAKCDGDRRF